MTSQFDTEGSYFAQITEDGKLKIWNTASNTLEQEYVPDVHLISPCTCLQFVDCTDGSTANAASPKNKRRKKKTSSLEIILGTTSGKLLIFSISKGDIKCIIDGNVNLPVSCLSPNCGEIMYSGIDENVVAWNIRQRNIASKWKAGNDCISAILAISSKKLLTASKSIKLWNIKDKTILKTFKGHSSNVNLLYSVPSYDLIESNYVISGSKSDRLLNCWNISDDVEDIHTSASLLLEDYVTNISLNSNEGGSTKFSVSISNGAVHIFEVVLNGKCTKPIKPKSTVRVVADNGQKEEVIIPISIVSSYLRNENTILIAHGSPIVLTFEELGLNKKKLICLIRQHPHMQKQNEIQTDKVIIPLVGNNATYLTPFSNVATSTKRKVDGAREVTMEKRLENLTFNKEDGPVPRSNNMAHLLMQGLRSKDQKIIKTVMLTTNEQIVRNTIRRLPGTVINELVEHLGVLMQGNNHIQAQAAGVWLNYLLEINLGFFMHNPDRHAIFSTIKNYTASELVKYDERIKFGAKLKSLFSKQRKFPSNKDEEDEDEALVFNDRDSESEGESMDIDENEDLDQDMDDLDEIELSDYHNDCKSIDK